MCGRKVGVFLKRSRVGRNVRESKIRVCSGAEAIGTFTGASPAFYKYGCCAAAYFIRVSAAVSGFYGSHGTALSVGDCIQAADLISDQLVGKHILRLMEKMQNTLDYCREVVNKRTRYHIEQTKVLIRRNS